MPTMRYGGSYELPISRENGKVKEQKHERGVPSFSRREGTERGNGLLVSKGGAAQFYQGQLIVRIRSAYLKGGKKEVRDGKEEENAHDEFGRPRGR
jgi:hypothetical protein